MKGRDVILGLLKKKERTGYELKEVFQSIFQHFFDGSYGMIYPTLRQLEREQKIEKRVILQEGRPNKNEFTITETGEQEFEEYLHSSVDSEIRKSDFLMRMYFGEYLSEEELRKFINNKITENRKRISQLQSDYEKWKKGLTVSQQISFDIGIAQYTSEIEVLEKYLKEIITDV